MQLGSFGATVFSVSSKRVLTFNNVRRNSSHAYSEHKRLFRPPRLESSNRALQTIQLEVQLFRYLGVEPALELKKLRQMCNDAEVNILILGKEICGRFVLESVDEKIQQVSAYGTTLLAQASLTFKEFVE